MPSVVSAKCVMLSVTGKPLMLSVIMLNVLMLSVFMLSVVAPFLSTASPLFEIFCSNLF
jgi:hypothetical protein